MVKEKAMFEFYEFFAGGGMARAGLGSQRWRCRFANDYDQKKCVVYARNWGSAALKTADVRNVSAKELPGQADLAWASFPCQDLSLAGGGAGLKGDRSGTFWPFWELMQRLMNENRGPRIIALENVCGTLTSHQGRDFAAICSTFNDAGYTFGAIVVDAALFVPQSRPRLFIIGVRDDVAIPEALSQTTPSSLWHTRGLRSAYERASSDISSWVWWSLPNPKIHNVRFAELIEEEPSDVAWHTPAQTQSLLQMMSRLHRAKVETVQAINRRVVGTIYKRTRTDETGRKVQRAEVRFDDVAGCLRTPAGGSSRQVILVVEGERIRSRLISGRETARLMGLSDDYFLPENYNEAYHLTGDGVVVPVVRHLAEHLFEPILTRQINVQKKAA